MSTPTFVWGKLTGSDFENSLHAIYVEVVHWRRNCFSIPFGKGGKDFVKELSMLYLAYRSTSALEFVALRAAIVLPILLLQKPSRTSKTKQHIALLESRLGLWSNGDLDELVREGRAMQQRLPKNGPTTANSSLARSFSNLMFMGKSKAALDLLSRGEKGGILHLNDHVNPDDPLSLTVRESLVQKHPVGQPAYSSCIVPDEPQDSHPVIFQSLDANAIHSATLSVNGAAGPSGLDSHEWRHLCTSHKGASRDLCAALESVAVRVCTTHVDPSSITPPFGLSSHCT